MKKYRITNTQRKCSQKNPGNILAPNKNRAWTNAKRAAVIVTGAVPTLSCTDPTLKREVGRNA